MIKLFQLCLSCFVLLPIVLQAAEKPLLLRSSEEIFTEPAVLELANAAAEGDEEKVEQLVRDGMPVDSTGYGGVTPLWWAFQKLNLAGFEKLLELGADPNHQWPEYGYNSVMDQVVQIANPGYLTLALKYGGNPNLPRPTRQGSFGETPIFRALFSSESSLEIFELLIEHGADINVKNYIDRQPANVAASLGRYDVLYLLLENGAEYLTEAGPAKLNVPYFVQLSIDKSSQMSEEKAAHRKKVIDFLEDRGVVLSDYKKESLSLTPNRTRSETQENK